MKKWILKAFIQKTISFLPGSHKINYLFQKHITKGVDLNDQYFNDKLTHAADHLSYYKKHNNSSGFSVLELGSGWYPVVPVALFLGGAEKIISIDISSLMTHKGIFDTIDKFIEWKKEGKLYKLEPFIKEERWEQLITLFKEKAADVCKQLKLQLYIKDARQTGFPDNTFDLICSNNTFEHIYPEILRAILEEFQRILKPGGLMSHFIDMSDHFAHLDKSITIYNFLRFSEKQWKQIDNSVQPQNRWRLKDYRNLYEELNISIVEEYTRKGFPEQVKSLNIHNDFKDYQLTELAVSHAHLVSTK